MVKGKGPSVLGVLRTGKYNVMSAVSYYRVYAPLSKMTGVKAEVVDSGSLKNIIEKGFNADGLLRGRKIYYISRLYRSKGLKQFVDYIHGFGGILVFDTDDDLTERYRDLDGRGDEFIETMSQMDHIVVSTPYLSSRIESEIGRKPFVFENHIDTEWFSSTSLEQERVVDRDKISIGLIGTPSHYEDWVPAADAIKRIAKERPDVEVLVAGYVPDYMEGECLRMQAVPYNHYPRLMRQFDIVCCCIDESDRFNLSKSAIKALEAMAAARPVNGSVGGAVPVCSDVSVYRRCVNDGHNGLLVKDDWYNTLSALIDDRELVAKLSINGLKWVKKSRDVSKGYVKLQRFLRHIGRE